MKTRAAILREMGLSTPYAKSKPLKLENIKLSSPLKNEVMIKVKAVGLCHSDLSVIHGSRPRPMPMVLGHEAAGKIVEVGQGVTDFQKGDHVVCTCIPSCGQCLYCNEGRPALCEKGALANEKGEMINGGKRISSEYDGDIHHHLGVSGFSEYAVVSTNSIVKVDPHIPFEQVALF